MGLIELCIYKKEEKQQDDTTLRFDHSIDPLFVIESSHSSSPTEVGSIDDVVSFVSKLLNKVSRLDIKYEKPRAIRLNKKSVITYQNLSEEEQWRVSDFAFHAQQAIAYSASIES